MSGAVREIRRLLAAVQYFTRIPVPPWVGHGQTLLDAAARYFPAVGALVGGLAAAILWGASLIWSMPVAVALSLAASVLVTGAFHEDGLADAVDGLGGSRERSRALEIMKDSRIGTFGTLALLVVLLLKFTALNAAPVRLAALALIAGHSVSRLGGVLVMATLPYVRETADSRSKPLVEHVSPTSVLFACATAALTLVPLRQRGIAGAAAAIAVCLLWRVHLKRRLGGYTGDCLGAAQQLGECAFYLACTAAR